LAELRALPAEKLLEMTAKPGTPWFSLTVDGLFFPEDPAKVFAAGKQEKVPLLVGWNSEEMNYRMVMGQGKPTLDNYTKAVQKLYGEHSAGVLKVYNVSSDDDVEKVATDLASDRFIGFSTWKWSYTHSKTGGKPVYRYLYARPRPEMRPEMGNATAGLAGGVIRDTSASKAPKIPPATGAVHSAEIEYALGNLPTNRVYDWQPEDYKVSEIMQTYFVNFVKTGNPNGLGVPAWTAVGKNKVEVMHIDMNTRSEESKNEDRYLFLNQPTKK